MVCSLNISYHLCSYLRFNSYETKIDIVVNSERHTEICSIKRWDIVRRVYVSRILLSEVEYSNNTPNLNNCIHFTNLITDHARFIHSVLSYRLIQYKSNPNEKR